MRISSSNIGMDSARSYTSATTRSSYFSSRSLTLKKGYSSFAGLMAEGEEEGAKAKDTGNRNTDFSSFQLKNAFKPVNSISRVAVRSEMEALDRIRQQCIQYLMQLFYPQRFQNRRSFEDFGDQLDSGGDVEGTYTLNTLSLQESYYEEETTGFQTTGTVVTADGRQIDFGLELSMSRRFQQTVEVDYQTLSRRVDVCDPLVINLDGNIAEVSDQKFTFDIDGDGILDTISQLNAGSGYLALDKNGDGIINDGNELFGPKSGDGFADLAKYDEDGNGWIDENDEIWSKLLIWTKDESGNDKLYHLAEKGVGAICLQNVSTDFSLNSLHDNQTNGIIRSTGIFLYENGNVGTVQHLDLAR